MQIYEEHEGAMTILKPQGSLSRSHADQLKQRVEMALKASLPGEGVVIDVASVPLVDSRGLEVLVEISGALAKNGQLLKLCSPNETIRRVFELTDIASLFEYFDDAQAAVRSLT